MSPAGVLPTRLQAVTFDCWNTLLVERDWTEAHARRVDALGETARAAGRDLPREQLLGVFDAAWNHHIGLWTRGIASGAAEVARHALHALGLDGEPGAAQRLVGHWQEASHSNAVEAVAGARAALERLARSGLRLGLVCDTGLTPGRVVRRHLERTGLLEHLDGCAFSDEVGVPKPDPKPFVAALAMLGADPSAALHVGDLRRTDVAGARGVGMASVRLRAIYDDPSALPDADFVVDEHAALATLLLTAAAPHASRAAAQRSTP
jgi:putative hydrolase of the HAD superfamily